MCRAAGEHKPAANGHSQRTQRSGADGEKTQVDATKFAFAIQDAGSVNHIVVFLLGTIPFQPGYGATVHMLWPGKQQWQLLGIQLRNTAGEPADMSIEDLTGLSAAATLGISVEPLPLILSQMSSLPAASASSPSLGAGPPPSSSAALVPAAAGGGHTVRDPTAVALRILENFYNYVTSFAASSVPAGAQVLGPPAQVVSPNAVVPVRIFVEWYNKICAKVKADPSSLFKDA
ncbi:MAG: hypothetical protein BJ554DRAFT_5374 [Olpidium bornovanus]|uniref:Hikeshi-like domain-containing protein n=1 Tax=Olpidium bornovanus TaxID=278681 RepID=A0A8H7ZZX3_9FUNG|nr:MAG: hypothetical protein BJ554DRAFT_5374 [Olpidium bornovanus]